MSSLKGVYDDLVLRGRPSSLLKGNNFSDNGP